jgi:hypothetical protein
MNEYTLMIVVLVTGVALAGITVLMARKDHQDKPKK